MKKLEVFFCGWGQHWLLGMLADNGTELLFEYSPQALTQGIELSPHTLKLRAGAYGGCDKLHCNSVGEVLTY